MDIKGVPGREGSIVYYKPQLVHPDLPPQQMDKIGSSGEIKKYNQNNGCSERSPQYQRKYKLGWSQALDDNFGLYDRGHLNPAGHHKEDASKVTMTHTNVAPQDRRMNNGPWNRSPTSTSPPSIIPKGSSTQWLGCSLSVLVVVSLYLSLSP
ncbi:uncharacterized protein isoform X3 [Salmo salar]|uniref:Uncharacterized protein isoform X3 n=1 Tax=Salmo salar TaxID=8030 RepID=A0ABM3ENI2_SALSA|nr:uncharacterized protein LOC106602539 isoform X3 [Salmo salar]